MKRKKAAFNCFGFSSDGSRLQIECSHHYTTDGTDPHPGSAVYQTPLQFGQDITIKAMAVRIGWKESSIASVNYTFTFDQTVASPIISPPSGTYTAAQIVYITCETAEATIHYTLDGSEPTEDSAVFDHYSSTIVVRDTRTIQAKAFKLGWNPSLTTTASYAIDIAPIEMILVPQGTFTMGDTRGVTNGWALPTHSVTLNSFYMGKYEVTQAEWVAIIGSNPSHAYNGIGDNYPVNQVSWYAILRYCNLRSMAEGLVPIYSISGSTNPDHWGDVPDTWDHQNAAPWGAAICNWSANGYRLPTEAEWEYAARGATNTPDYLYSGSDDIDAVGWYIGNNTPNGSKPVGTKAPNGLGIYDMSGNILEWCWDAYDDYSSEPQTNPTGPASGSYRMLRGGRWSNSHYTCFVATREGDVPSAKPYHIGFRLCRSAP